MPAHPLILSRDEVNALRTGRREPLRRPALRQPSAATTILGYQIVLLGDDRYQEALLVEDGLRTATRCPYGATGSLLWVRESFAVADDGHITYRADEPSGTHRWHSPIYMPRAYARLTLTITRATLDRSDGRWSWLLDCRHAEHDPTALAREASAILGSMTSDERTRYDRLRAIGRIIGE